MIEEQNYNGGESSAVFNSGLAISWHIHEGFTQCTTLRLERDWEGLFDCLEAIEIKLSSPLSHDKENQDILDNLKKKYLPIFYEYIRRKNWLENRRHRLLSPTPKVIYFLSQYEKHLLFLRDKYGYGMPLKADSKSAAFR